MRITPHLAAVLASTAMVLAIGVMIAAAALCRSLRKKVDTVRDELDVSGANAQKCIELACELEQVQLRLAEIEQRRSPLADWFPEPASVNLNRRGQVLRLHRRGESSGEIASALGLSQGEVRLIITIHNMSGVNAGAEKSNERSLKSRRIFDRDTTEPITGDRRA